MARRRIRVLEFLFEHQCCQSQKQRADACLEDVFAAVLEMDGTISGEHGIGLVKRDWVARELDATSLAIMHAIKRQFDPAGILNPGKALPPAG